MQSGQGSKGYEVQTCRDLIGDIEPILAMGPLFAAKRMNSGGDRCTRYSANCGKSKLFAMMKTLSGSSSALERQLEPLPGVSESLAMSGSPEAKSWGAQRGRRLKTYVTWSAGVVQR